MLTRMAGERFTSSRSLRAVVGAGLVRGLGCGVVLGAVSGAVLAVWCGVHNAPGGAGAFAGTSALLRVAAIAAGVGALIGVVSAAAALVVLAGAGRGRSSWAVSVLAAVVAAMVSVLALSRAWRSLSSDVAALSQAWEAFSGTLVSTLALLLVGLVNAVVALWQVRRLDRRTSSAGLS